MSARRRLSASARVQIAMTGVLIASITALVVLGYWVTARQLIASSDDLLSREAEAYSAAVAGAPAGAGLVDATRSYLEGRSGEGAGFAPILFVRLASGRVVSNTDLRLEDAVPDALGANEPGYVTLMYQGTSYRVLAVPVTASGERAGVFVVALATSTSHETATTVAFTLAAAGAFALAIGVPLSYLATRRALRPLSRMAVEATDISYSRPGQRITYAGPADELGALSRALNSMLDRLEASYDDQRRFVADASHELRTPVAVIRGNVELLRTAALDADESAESLEMIEHEANRMVRLLDDLLALARLEGTGKGRFQPLEVRSLVTDVASRARALADRDITFTGECDVWTLGDPDLLDQALANLVRNAIAHTEPGGDIEVGCERTPETVRISVTDDGPGIPDADLQRVFDRFYRAPGHTRSGEGGGAGLGLAIARRLVELHDGRMDVHNVSPHGACFTIELPRLETPESDSHI